MNDLTEKMTSESYIEMLNNMGKKFRERMMVECDVSEPTLYRYFRNPNEMPKLVREKFQQIAKETSGVEILFEES